jgi:hypothetical protein
MTGPAQLGSPYEKTWRGLKASAIVLPLKTTSSTKPRRILRPGRSLFHCCVAGTDILGAVAVDEGSIKGYMLVCCVESLNAARRMMRIRKFLASRAPRQSRRWHTRAVDGKRESPSSSRKRFHHRFPDTCGNGTSRQPARYMRRSQLSGKRVRSQPDDERGDDQMEVIVGAEAHRSPTYSRLRSTRKEARLSEILAWLIPCTQ